MGAFNFSPFYLVSAIWLENPYPTECFSVPEPQQSFDVFELHKASLSMDFVAPKMWKGRPGIGTWPDFFSPSQHLSFLPVIGPTNCVACSCVCTEKDFLLTSRCNKGRPHVSPKLFLPSTNLESWDPTIVLLVLPRLHTKAIGIHA